jgi:hypothetical protein
VHSAQPRTLLRERGELPRDRLCGQWIRLALLGAQQPNARGQELVCHLAWQRGHREPLQPPQRRPDIASLRDELSRCRKRCGHVLNLRAQRLVGRVRLNPGWRLIQGYVCQYVTARFNHDHRRRIQIACNQGFFQRLHCRL